jgi:hypothetical protein
MSKDPSTDQLGDAATNVEHADNVNVVPADNDDSGEPENPDGKTDTSE